LLSLFAIATYEQAIAINPTNEQAYFNRGCAYQKLHNYIKAEQDFSKLLQINIHNPQALFNRALANRHLGRYLQAITDLENTATEFLAQENSDGYQKAIDLVDQLRYQIYIG